MQLQSTMLTYLAANIDGAVNYITSAIKHLWWLKRTVHGNIFLLSETVSDSLSNCQARAKCIEKPQTVPKQPEALPPR